MYLRRCFDFSKVVLRAWIKMDSVEEVISRSLPPMPFGRTVSLESENLNGFLHCRDPGHSIGGPTDESAFSEPLEKHPDKMDHPKPLEGTLLLEPCRSAAWIGDGIPRTVGKVGECISIEVEVAAWLCRCQRLQTAEPRRIKRYALHRRGMDGAGSGEQTADLQRRHFLGKCNQYRTGTF
jgi:hypothetical protein